MVLILRSVLFSLLLLAPVAAFLPPLSSLHVSPSLSFSRSHPILIDSSTTPGGLRFRSPPSSGGSRRPTRLRAATLSPGNGTVAIASSPEQQSSREDRFQRTAALDTVSEQECILQIDGVRYNLTQWAKAHPGGVKILRKFHNKDASRAFHAASHSNKAYAMLQNDFEIVNEQSSATATATLSDKHATTNKHMSTSSSSSTRNCPIHSVSRRRPRWRQKLFTKEDPIGVHKYLGIYCLAHFAFRFYQMYFGDLSAGLGTRMGKGASLLPALAVLPHALLSLSSLIFHTVPAERVVGKPMIWQEFRAHNIVFGVRSVICTLLAWSTYYFHNHGPWVRRVAVIGSCATAFAANVIADQATERLRVNNAESTTATMPYWEGCSVQTQKRFKLFYAYCQFMATMACIAVCSPSWGLAVLLAIQGASLLMTLVRKGFVSPRGYHIGYTITLVMPYLVGIRCGQVMGPLTFPLMCAGGAVLFQLRRLGLNKYLLWLPIYAARILIGDRFIPYNVW